MLTPYFFLRSSEVAGMIRNVISQVCLETFLNRERPTRIWLDRYLHLRICARSGVLHHSRTVNLIQTAPRRCTPVSNTLLPSYIQQWASLSLHGTGPTHAKRKCSGPIRQDCMFRLKSLSTCLTLLGIVHLLIPLVTWALVPVPLPLPLPLLPPHPSARPHISTPSSPACISN
jgi:hypothetical protein